MALMFFVLWYDTASTEMLQPLLYQETSSESTQQAVEKAELHSLEINAGFHQLLICLHAFPDGNGRTQGGA